MASNPTPDQPVGKPIYKSKMFWLNAAGAAAIVLRCIAEQRMPSMEESAVLFGFLSNIGLRLKTDQPITR